MNRYQCLVTNMTGVQHAELRTDSRDEAEKYCAQAIEDGCLSAEVQAVVGAVIVSYWDPEELEFLRAEQQELIGEGDPPRYRMRYTTASNNAYDGPLLTTRAAADNWCYAAIAEAGHRYASAYRIDDDQLVLGWSRGSVAHYRLQMAAIDA
jgi:hypothetical protein